MFKKVCSVLINCGKSAVFIVLFFLPSYLFASKDDSLKPDSNLVKLLLDSAYTLESSDSKAALNLYQKASLISEEINYVLGHAKALHYSGIVYSDKSEYEPALLMYRRALRLYKRINYRRGIGACYVNMGNLFHFRSKLDSALLYYQFSITPFKQSSQLNALSQSYSNVGVIFQKMGQLKKSYDYQNKAVQLARQINDSIVLTRALINEGAVLYEMKEFEKFVKVEREALKIAELISDDYGLQITNINIADYYKNKEEYSKAIKYGLKSLEYALKLATPYDVADIKKRIGDLYFLNGDYNTAKVFFEDAILQSKQIKATEISADTYFSLQKLYAKLGEYKQAYNYQSLAQQYQDSIFGEKQVKLINELEVKYQAAQKEKTLAKQRLQIAQKEVQLQKSNRYILFSIGAVILALLGILLILLHYRNKRRLHQQQLKSLKQEKEILILQALMQGEEKERSRIARDLHDEVAGMLAAAKMHMNSLAMQAKEIIKNSGYSQAIRLLDDASDSVRKTAHNLMPEILIQQGLDTALERYCNSINNKRLIVRYNSFGEISRYEDSFELSIYRIAQEVLNNVLKHSKASEALVQLNCNEDMLCLTIEDNGVGFDTSKDVTGTGLQSIRKRVESLQGIMELDSRPGEGVSIYLEFNTRVSQIRTILEY